jgi:hypothetical protein
MITESNIEKGSEQTEDMKALFVRAIEITPTKSHSISSISSPETVEDDG